MPDLSPISASAFAEAVDLYLSDERSRRSPPGVIPKDARITTNKVPELKLAAQRIRKALKAINPQCDIHSVHNNGYRLVISAS